MLYIPDKNPDGSKPTWGQLFSQSSTQIAWRYMQKELEQMLETPRGALNEMIREIVNHLRIVYGSKPVRYIVEVQLMLSEYLAMRKQR